MDLNDLFKMLTEGEGPLIEFKVCFPEKAIEIAQVMASFVNTNGGTILIGVDDHGKPVGVTDADKTIQRLVGVAQKNCRPPLEPEIGKITIESGKEVIWVHIQRLTDSPCLVDGRIYVRLGSISTPLEDPYMLRRFLTSVGAGWLPLESKPHQPPPKIEQTTAIAQPAKKPLQATFKEVYLFARNYESGMGKTNSDAEFFAKTWIEKFVDKDFGVFKEIYQFATNDETGMGKTRSDAEFFTRTWIEKFTNKDFGVFKEVYQFATNYETGMGKTRSDAEFFARKWIEKFANKDFGVFKEVYQFATNHEFGMGKTRSDAEFFAVELLSRD